MRRGSQGEDSFKKERFVVSVAYSPDGKRVASGSMDGSVCVWDASSSRLLHTLPGHFKAVRALTFTPGAPPSLPPSFGTSHAHRPGAASGAIRAGKHAGALCMARLPVASCR